MVSLVVVVSQALVVGTVEIRLLFNPSNII